MVLYGSINSAGSADSSCACSHPSIQVSYCNLRLLVILHSDQFFALLCRLPVCLVDGQSTVLDNTKPFFSWYRDMIATIKYNSQHCHAKLGARKRCIYGRQQYYSRPPR